MGTSSKFNSKSFQFQVKTFKFKVEERKVIRTGWLSKESEILWENWSEIPTRNASIWILQLANVGSRLTTLMILRGKLQKTRRCPELNFVSWREHTLRTRPRCSRSKQELLPSSNSNLEAASLNFIFRISLFLPFRFLLRIPIWMPFLSGCSLSFLIDFP